MSTPVVADDGCQLWTTAEGDGPPLVLCHGGPGLWDYFDGVLGGAVVRRVRWDQRGCGRSERRGPYTIDRFVADLDAVRAHYGVERVDVLGHSWGAMLGLRYALAHPERVRRLVYVSGTGVDPGQPWRAEFQRNLERGVEADAARWRELEDRDRTPEEDREHAILQWTADFVDPATARARAEQLGTPWLGINYECARALNAEAWRYLEECDVPALCRTLTVPTLIVDGAHDIRPRWGVDSLEQALPDVRRVTLLDAGHIPWAEDPVGFREAVMGFLA
jgi:proline iminopeptidase